MKDDVNGNLRWDKDKKKQRDEDREARDRHKMQSEAKKEVGQLYAEWKGKLGNKIRTNNELEDSVLRLREDIRRVLANRGLDELLEGTMRLLDDKEQTLAIMAAMDPSENRVTQYIPLTHQGVEPVQAVFKTKTEFEAIPFVAAIMAQEGFIGLLREPGFIHAVMHPDEVIMVGEVLNDNGLLEYPPLKRFQEDLNAKNN